MGKTRSIRFRKRRRGGRKTVKRRGGRRRSRVTKRGGRRRSRVTKRRGGSMKRKGGMYFPPSGEEWDEECPIPPNKDLDYNCAHYMASDKFAKFIDDEIKGAGHQLIYKKSGGRKTKRGGGQRRDYETSECISSDGSPCLV